MPYSLELSDRALSRLEELGAGDAKKLRQVFLKILALRRNPYPQDSRKLENFQYRGLKGLRVDQGEYRIGYAVDEKAKKIMVGLVLSRKEDYRELR